jgi:hypothetical protein
MDFYNHCKSEFCMNGGHCPGCKLGKINCDDKECAPYCRGCELIRNHDTCGNIVFFIIFVILLIICFSLLLTCGPRFVIFHDGDRNKPREPDNTFFD